MDNSRAVEITLALANYLGVDINQLPVVASAPEPTSEKAISIGTYAVAAGLPTHVGVMLPVMGSALVTKILTETVKELTGGYFMVEPDPVKAADLLLQAINDRRAGLGLE